jgi:hypothetical protein
MAAFLAAVEIIPEISSHEKGCPIPLITSFASMAEKQWKQSALFCVTPVPSFKNALPFALAE